MSRRRGRRAYDRMITVFSPEGRLLQVEYALEVVKRGSTILATSSLEGVVLAADIGEISQLNENRFARKLFKVDDHVGALISGLSSDARVLIDRARRIAQGYRLMYDEPVDIKVLAKNIADQLQVCTQQARMRPFGVSLIFGGVDNAGPQALQCDPSGVYRRYKAVSLGEGSEASRKILNEEYGEELSLEESTRLAIKCLAESIRDKLTSQRIKIAWIPTESKQFKKLTDIEIQGYVSETSS